MSRTEKIFLTLNLAIAALVFLGNYFYLTVGGLLLKSLCSGGFALMGIINLCYTVLSGHKRPVFHILLSVGLLLSMLGDIFIGPSFVAGAALFALGHICYLTAFAAMEKIRKSDIIISAAIFAAAGAFILFCPLLHFDSEYMRWVCFIYAMIISMMGGKAFGSFIRERSALRVIIAVGALLFIFSDLMLVLDWFMGLPSWSGKLCMAAYYPALCTLAFSGFYKTRTDIFVSKTGT